MTELGWTAVRVRDLTRGGYGSRYAGTAGPRGRASPLSLTRLLVAVP